MTEEQLTRIEQKIDYIIAILEKQGNAEVALNEPMPNQIIVVQRAQTKSSNSPMWRCTLVSGHQVNVFLHTDPDKNNFNLIEGTGYEDDFKSMELDETVTWNSYPIAVTVRKDGKWWTLVSVAPKVEGSSSDHRIASNIADKLTDLPF